MPSSAMRNRSSRWPAGARPARSRRRVRANFTKSTSRTRWKRLRWARASPIATMAARSRSSPPRTSVIGAPCRVDSTTRTSTSVVGIGSKPAGMAQAPSFDAASIARSAPSSRSASIRPAIRAAACPAPLAGSTQSEPIAPIRTGRPSSRAASRPRTAVARTTSPSISAKRRRLAFAQAVFCRACSNVANAAALRPSRAAGGRASMTRASRAPSATTNVGMAAWILDRLRRRVRT